MTGAGGDAAAVFDPLRPRLVRVACRMPGSVADAEDAVQEAFIRWMGADRDGDMKRLGAMLAAEVSLHADGGGMRSAVSRPIRGFDAVLRVHEALAEVFRGGRSTLVRTAFVNGRPGFVTRDADGELQATALEIADGKVAAIYVMRNPEKLRHLH